MGRPREYLVYHVSNACRALLDSAVHAANLIDLLHIDAGPVLGAESDCDLVESTDRRRQPQRATNTAGSEKQHGLAHDRLALLLEHHDIGPTGDRLLAVALRANAT